MIQKKQVKMKSCINQELYRKSTIEGAMIA